jgi:hypothetical protein
MIHLLSIKSEVIIIKLIIEYTTLMVHVQLVHIIVLCVVEQEWRTISKNLYVSVNDTH